MTVFCSYMMRTQYLRQLEIVNSSPPLHSSSLLFLFASPLLLSPLLSSPPLFSPLFSSPVLFFPSLSSPFLPFSTHVCSKPCSYADPVQPLEFVHACAVCRHYLTVPLLILWLLLSLHLFCSVPGTHRRDLCTSLTLSTPCAFITTHWGGFPDEG